MGVHTYDQYLERLKKLKRNIYMRGEKVDRLEIGDMRGSLFAIKETYDRANDPRVRGIVHRHLPPDRRAHQPLHPHSPEHR